jgi:acyl-CoA synthetase (AMP-forming)/AMP-acid ligase II
MYKIAKYCTLIELLRWRAIHQSERQAYTFLENGETEAAYLTYGELDRQARAIAAQLQSWAVTGERALLLYPPGLQFIAAFFGCLYAGVVAIPAPPPDPSRLQRILPRLRAIAKDARATLVLTTRNYSQLKETSSQLWSESQTMRWLVSEKVPSQLAEEWQEPTVSGDTLAYLQYTSGSTSTPKGVMISHENLMHHSACINGAWGYTPDSIAATWMPAFHDYGLVDGLMQPLYAGIPCYVMSPMAFIKRPICWLQTISRYKVTHSGATNFAYDLCLRQIGTEQRTTLDLSSWRTASNGAEPIRKKTVECFIETFQPYGFRPEAFYPSYGLAEATLLVSTKRHGDVPVICTVQAQNLEKHRVVESQDQKDVRTVVSCGSPIDGMKVAIADPETLRQCAPLEVGEIWVSDRSVALGYWRKPEETKRTFHAYLTDTGEGPFLRTGDIGFLKDGELFVTGRIKDLIIIRGRNHYPQDIELTVEQSHPALRSGYGAAFAVSKDEERLVVVQEVERSYLRRLDVGEVVGNIREAIADWHELQVYAVVLIKPGSIPKTSSGKIQRQEARAKFLDATLDRLDWGIETHAPQESSLLGAV